MDYDDVSEAFRLRQQLKNDVSNVEPLGNEWGSYGVWRLVGHGSKTNEYCGRYFRSKGCLRVDLHDRIMLDGRNFKGKVFVRKVHHWCFKSSCPVCYRSGWATREAGNIEVRSKEASKRFGEVFHIICSVPPKDYALDFEALCKKAEEILFARGVVDGSSIWHPFRFKWGRGWYWSPHFHVLGFILGGYGRCRHCGVSPSISACRGCGGFEDRTRQLNAVDGWIIKVKDKRKTVFGTAWYQLHHSGVDVTKKRFHVTRWFGVVSYRKLKLTPEKREELCPICKHELEWVKYCGKRSFVTDRSSPDYERDSYEDFEEDGLPAWFAYEPKGFG
jgi:hypothetical protein